MTKKLLDVAGRKQVTVEPSVYAKNGPVVFSHPDRHTNSMQPSAQVAGYKFPHLQANARTGT